MSEHHIWCSWTNKPAETCSLCARLREKYPQIVDDPDGSLLASKYFPKAQVLKSRRKGKKYLSDCQICDGLQGDVKGNESIVDGIVMCNSCSTEYDNMKQAITKGH
jgi:hypothetical protein